YGASFALDGSASVDAGGGSIVSYQWTKLSGEGGPMVINQVIETAESTLTIESPASDPLELGRHRFRLVVIDDSGNASAPDEREVIVAAQPAPTAVPHAPLSGGYGASFVLDGSASFDAGGGSIVSYRWTKLSGEGGSMAINQLVETAEPTLTNQSTPGEPLERVPHPVRLVVIDDSGKPSMPDEREVIVA